MLAPLVELIVSMGSDNGPGKDLQAALTKEASNPSKTISSVIRRIVVPILDVGMGARFGVEMFG
jgi:hypothetical protein